MKDVLDNPTLLWDLRGLSGNPNITMKDVLDNPDKDWNWYHLSKNSNIKMKDIIDNHSLPWELEGLSENPNITMKFIKKNLITIDSSSKGMTLRKNKFNNYEHLETKFIFDKTTKKVIGKQLDDGTIIELTIEDIEVCKKYRFKYLIPVMITDKLIKKESIIKNDRMIYQWDWDSLSENPNITLKDVLDNPNLPWDFKMLSRNPNITMKFVMDNLDENWDWNSLSENKFKYDKNFQTIQLNKIRMNKIITEKILENEE